MNKQPTRYAAFDAFFGIPNSAEAIDEGEPVYVQFEQLDRLEKLLATQSPQLAQSTNDQQTTMSTQRQINELKARTAALTAERDAYKAKVEAHSQQQGQRRWQDKTGSYTTVQPTNTPTPDTTEEDRKQRQEQRKWQNQFGRYSTSTLQGTDTSSAKTPSHLDPDNPLNQRADRRTGKVPR